MPNFFTNPLDSVAHYVVEQTPPPLWKYNSCRYLTAAQRARTSFYTMVLALANLVTPMVILAILHSRARNVAVRRRTLRPQTWRSRSRRIAMHPLLAILFIFLGLVALAFSDDSDGFSLHACPAQFAKLLEDIPTSVVYLQLPVSVVLTVLDFVGLVW